MTTNTEIVASSHKPHKINEKSTPQREVLSNVFLMRVTGLKPTNTYLQGLQGF